MAGFKRTDVSRWAEEADRLTKERDKQCRIVGDLAERLDKEIEKLVSINETLKCVVVIVNYKTNQEGIKKGK